MSSICLSTVVGMIEHGIVEASSYAPSRVLSPTLHTVGDFVEIRYQGEKAETSSLSSQTQAAAQPTGSNVSPAGSKQNGSMSDTWKTVEESLIGSCTNSEALTLIPCESGSVGSVMDMSEIELCDKSPLSSGDATVKYGNDSPGVHSTHSKTGIALLNTGTVPVLSKTTALGVSSAEIVCEKTSATYVDCKTTVVSDEADDVGITSTDIDSEPNIISTQMKTTSTGMI